MGGASGKVIRLFSSWLSTFGRDTTLEECGIELSAVITWVGLGLNGGAAFTSVSLFFVLIILYSLYLEYDSPLIPSASGLAG